LVWCLRRTTFLLEVHEKNGCMKPTPALSPAVQVAVAAIVLLGLLGGSLIVAHSGFGTSPRRGGPSIFVPAPQAYLLAATMYGMSAIGMLALLRGRNVSWLSIAIAVVLYAAAATLLVAELAP
jgi:hypothetical protein